MRHCLRMPVRRIMPYHESPDFAATRAFYGPVDEPWGVRRFFVRGPDGVVLSVLAHD